MQAVFEASNKVSSFFRFIPTSKLKLVSGGLAAFVLCISMSGCGGTKASSGAQPAREAVPVTVANVVRKPVPLQVRAIGAVEAFSTIQVRAQVGGELTAVHFQEGQEVKRGDLLFTIDPRQAQESIHQYEAVILRDGAQIKQLEANMARDQAQSRHAQVQLERYDLLLSQGVVSKDQQEQLHANAEALTAALRADQAAIATAQEVMKADRATLENAKLQLAYYTIRSPIEGKTGSLMVHQGNLVKANEVPLVVINQISPIRISFAVPEQQLAQIKQYRNSLKVAAAIPGQDQQPLDGSISFVDNMIDNTTGTIRLKGEFANREKRLWPGQFVDLVLTLTTEPDVIVVPSQAVQTGQSGQFAFVVKDDLSVEQRPVVPLRTFEGQTVVSAGLQPGERVVTDGQSRLVAGAKVEIKKQTAANREAH